MSDTKGKAWARRRRALRVADDVGGIVGDAIHNIGVHAQERFREAAVAELSGRESFAVGDRPAPQVDTSGFWDGAEWDRAVDDAEGVLGEMVVDEFTRAGLAVTIEQPFVQEIVAGHVGRIEEYGLEAREHVTRSLQTSLSKGHSVDQAARALVAGDMRPRAAELIARTEMVAASNGAAMVSAKAAAAPGDMKVWLSTPDQRTRPTHRAADGQQVPIDQPFTVGGEKADYPGDPGLSLDGRGNCRCSWYVVQGRELRRVQPESRQDRKAAAAAETAARLAKQRKAATRGSVDPELLDRYGVNETQWRNARHQLKGVKADIRTAAGREADELASWLDDNSLAGLTRPTALKRQTDPVTGVTRSVRTESGYDFLETLSDEEARQIRRRFVESDLFTPDVVADQVRRLSNLDLSDDEAMDWLVERWLHADSLRSLSSGRVAKYANANDLLPGEYALDGYDVERLFGAADDAVGHLAQVQQEQAARFARSALGDPRHGPAPWEMDAGDYIRELEEVGDVLSSPPVQGGSGLVDEARARMRELAPPDIDVDGSMEPMALLEEIRITAQAAGYDVA